MTSHRIIGHSLAGGLALLALIVAPATAQAGSLLSGYGGPGEGNQAVLGSALIGGPRGGGSGGSGGAGAGSESGSSSSGSESSSRSSSGSEAPASGSGQARAGAGAAKHDDGAGSSAPNGGGSASSADGGGATGGAGAAGAQRLESFYPTTERVPAGGQGVVLGLTGEDILYIVLAAAALIAIGLLTRRLDRSSGQTGLGG